VSRPVSVAGAAELLRKADKVLILMHQYPDGDTIGSGYALCRALQAMGKTVRTACCDPIPPKYDYMTADVPEPDFEPQTIVAVDVADPQLLGNLQPLADRVALCIDHHASNKAYAEHLLLDAGCGAAAMIVADVIDALGVEFDRGIAECIYTGVATDTGCFKYANTDAAAHRLAARMIERGARIEMINREMFDIKSRARVLLERMALESIRFECGGKAAFMTITNAMIAASGAIENDMEGLAPIPRQIEGVWVGVTLRQKADGNYKVSVRTGTHADAAAICEPLGGGGHVRAAGCSPEGDADAVIDRLLQSIRRHVPRIDG
jgi:phosphoesterase RecJ-like protein